MLDLLLKVPSGPTAPIKYKPMEVDAINQVPDGRESRRSEVSVEDRSKGAETARPLRDEHCDCQFVSDSASSEKSEMNDTELNGETDDEDMEDGETGYDDGSAPEPCHTEYVEQQQQVWSCIWRNQKQKRKTGLFFQSRRPSGPESQSDNLSVPAFEKKKKGPHVAIFVFDMKQAQEMGCEFYHTLNGCVICFNTVPAENLRTLCSYTRRNRDEIETF